MILATSKTGRDPVSILLWIVQGAAKVPQWFTWNPTNTVDSLAIGMHCPVLLTVLIG